MRKSIHVTRREMVGQFVRRGSGLLVLAGLSSLAGCGFPQEELARTKGEDGDDGDDDDFVTLYDTHAQALYMDGTMGPTTGIVRVDYVLANVPVEMKFWHGHGGRDHFFTLTPDVFTQLKNLERAYLVTTEVDDHTHRLFIDPTNPRWRVQGAQPVKVPRQRRTS
jgi:hypothetical protein